MCSTELFLNVVYVFVSKSQYKISLSRVYIVADMIGFSCTSYRQDYCLIHSIASFMYCGTLKIVSAVSI